jgi:excisionase family DNA binding protein
VTAEKHALSVEEAGRALGVSTATVWRLIRRGELASVRLRGRRLIPRRALARRAARPKAAEIPPLTAKHPIFRLVGAGRGGGRRPGARDKHSLADA